MLFFATLRRDLILGWRQLVAHPIASIAVILTFAIGIGINTANFSIVNALLLAPLPFEEPKELVHLFRTEEGNKDEDRLGFSWPGLSDLQQIEVFDEVGAYSYGQRVVTSNGQDPVQISECQVSANLLPLLGTEPRIGRWFTEQQAIARNHRVALISSQLWRQRFGERSDITSQLIRLDGIDYEIFGVMPENFSFPFGSIKVWTPAVDDSGGSRVQRNLNVVARFSERVSFAVASKHAETLFAQLDRDHHGDEDASRLRVVPLREALVFFYDMVLVLMALATAANFLILVIVCSNVAILMVVRLSERRRELALRQSLGASRLRLILQVLVQGFLLSLIGAVLGLGVASLNLKLSARAIPEELYRAGTLGLDLRAFLFALAMAVLSTLLFALLPALRGTRDLIGDIRAAADGIGVKAGKLRRGAIVNQVLSLMVLVMGTVTVSRSFQAMQAVDTGFDSNGVLSFEIHLSGDRYHSVKERRGVFDNIKSGLEALPGASSVAYMTSLPLNFDSSTRKYRLPSEVAAGEKSWRSAREHRVSPDYFSTMDVALRSGRLFEASDHSETQRVAVVSATMGRRLWPQEEAVGERLTIIYSGKEREVHIIGVVEDTANFLLGEPKQPILYLSQAQFPARRNFFLVRSLSDPLALTSSARRVVERTDPLISLGDFRLMTEVVETSLTPWRLAAKSMMALAGLSMVLAAIGIYGLSAYTTATRAREFSIRLAIGARRQTIAWMLLKQTLKTVILGIGLGLGIYALLVQMLDRFISGVSVVDPRVVLIAASIVILTTLAASALPLLRVFRLDPSRTLRYE